MKVLEELWIIVTFFTWVMMAPFLHGNGRTGEALIRERLDHAVSTETWNNLFTMTKLHVLESDVSDHIPILPCLGGTAKSLGGKTV